MPTSDGIRQDSFSHTAAGQRSRVPRLERHRHRGADLNRRPPEPFSDLCPNATLWYNGPRNLEVCMPKRSKPKSQRRDWRWYASFALNAAVALSMVLGTVFLFTGGSVAQQAPVVPPTVTVGAPAPTVVPTATPKPAGQVAPQSPVHGAGLSHSLLPTMAERANSRAGTLGVTSPGTHWG